MRRLYRLIRTMLRAQRIAAISEDSFRRAIRSCANVSECNHSLCFLVHKIGAFGSPDIEQIDRPEEVIISENSNFVVIKDGVLYELNKTKFE